jgi:hypothetical protein
LSNAFFKVVHDILPDLEDAKKIRIEGRLRGQEFEVDIDHYGDHRMNITVQLGQNRIGITAEDQAYRTGEKSHVDVSDWTPTKQDIDRHIEFIENAFAGKLLPLPEKKPKRLKEEIPETAIAEETEKIIHTLHSETALTVPCETCSNDSGKGGDCHREHFHVVDDKEGYVCERKKPLEVSQ